MRHFLRFLLLVPTLAVALAIVGCDSGNTTVQPATPEPTPPTTGPVDEPPSSDGK